MKNTKNTLTLIFLGLQGCGKGTQTSKLIEKYPFQTIEPGSIFRKMAKTGKGDKEAVKIMSQGKLVSDSITNRIMDKEIKKIKNSISLILDGYPRSFSQAKHLDKILKATGRNENYYAVYFKISKKEALRRLLNRWICPKCNTIFSAKKTKCKCGGVPEKRIDEKPELIKNRFKYVSHDLDKIKDYYKKQKKLLDINAERSVLEISKDLIGRLGL